MTKDSVWDARNVSKAFPGVRALDSVSLRLDVGEVHALVGENGSGKSTLAKCLSGTYQPDAGEILYRGQVVQLRDPNAAQNLGRRTSTSTGFPAEADSFPGALLDGVHARRWSASRSRSMPIGPWGTCR